MVKQHLWLIFFLSSLPTGFLVGLAVGGVVATSPATTVSIEPQTSAWLPDTIFNITVVVTDVSELYGWQFNVTFNPAVLEALNFTEGPFLKQAGDTYELPVTINNTGGWVFAGRSLFPYPEHGASGSGILAYLTFKAKAEGASTLHLDAPEETTYLRTIDENQMPVPIGFTPVDGSVSVALVHDVAVTALTVSESKVTLGANVSIEVTVKNKGSVPETFNVTLSYDSTVIKIEAISELGSGASESLSFTWNTKDLAVGSYTLTATASTVSGENETADNTYSNVVVEIASPEFAWPIEVLIGVIVVVVVIGVGTFFYMKRR